jgi:hypothetical protein
MDASQLWYLEIVHSFPKYEFCFFYVSKVSKMLRNTRKHHFGSNGVEGMLHNFGTPKYCFRAQKTSFSTFTCRGLRNALKHFQTSFWVQWTRMDASQLWYPEIVHLGPKHKFCIFLRVEGYWNYPKHSQTSFWVQWTIMDASQLWYPKIVHSGSNRSFASCSCRKLVKSSQTLTNIILGPID